MITFYFINSRFCAAYFLCGILNIAQTFYFATCIPSFTEAGSPFPPIPTKEAPKIPKINIPIKINNVLKKCFVTIFLFYHMTPLLTKSLLILTIPPFSPKPNSERGLASLRMPRSEQGKAYMVRVERFIKCDIMEVHAIKELRN